MVSPSSDSLAGTQVVLWEGEQQMLCEGSLEERHLLHVVEF